MKEVTVYTQPGCPPCQIVKQFLNHHNITFTEKDISIDPVAREKLVDELQSTSTPTVTVNEEVVTGFNIQRLEELLEIRK